MFPELIFLLLAERCEQVSVSLDRLDDSSCCSSCLERTRGPDVLAPAQLPFF